MKNVFITILLCASSNAFALSETIVESKLTAKSIIREASTNVAVINQPHVEYSKAVVKDYSKLAVSFSKANGDKLCDLFGFGEMIGYDQGLFEVSVDIEKDNTFTINSEGHLRRAFRSFIICRELEASRELEVDQIESNQLTSKIVFDRILVDEAAKEVIIKKPRIKYSANILGRINTLKLQGGQKNGERLCAKLGYGKMLRTHEEESHTYRVILELDGTARVISWNYTKVIDDNIVCSLK